MRTEESGDLEANACPDHIHIPVSIPPKYSISQIMEYLRRKSSLMIFDRHANLKYTHGNQHFWARGYFVDTVGRNKKQIARYIQKQMEEDEIMGQMCLKEYIAPLRVARVPRHKKEPLKGGVRERNASGRPFGAPLGVRLYFALLELSHASGLAGDFNYSPVDLF